MTDERTKTLEIAALYGLERAPWSFWETYPTAHQCCVIVGQFVYGKPILEAAQYDGVNFFGYLGGRHNRQVWAWLDADVAYVLLMSRGINGDVAPVPEIPHLRRQFRPGAN